MVHLRTHTGSKHSPNSSWTHSWRLRMVLTSHGGWTMLVRSSLTPAAVRVQFNTRSSVPSSLPGLAALLSSSSRATVATLMCKELSAVLKLTLKLPGDSTTPPENSTYFKSAAQDAKQ